MLVPAKYHEASRLREVAVLPFDGKGGQGFAAEIEGTIASINIGDKQYFNLVDRVRLEKLISEMKLSQSALVDSNTAARVGRLVGAKGIYTGIITASDVSDSAYREERTRCAQTVTKHDKKEGHTRSARSMKNMQFPAQKGLRPLPLPQSWLK